MSYHKLLFFRIILLFTFSSATLTTNLINQHSSRQLCPLVLPTKLNSTPNEDKFKAQPRIVGGTIPHASLASHMVSFTEGFAFICTGSLISARWVVSAAHCKLQRPGIIAFVGGNTPTNGTQHEIERVIPHPQYETNRRDSPYDIALIKLREPAPENSNFIQINNNPSTPEDGAFSRVAGYGRTDGERQFFFENKRLLQVDVPVVAMQRCKQNFARLNSFVSISPDIQLCAGKTTGGCDACFGDSGGPLYVFDNKGGVVQIGVVSYGIGCARKDAPGVYTRINAFIPWMKQSGAVFRTSDDGVNVFSEGSKEAAYTGFTIGDLSTLPSILIMIGIAVIVGAIAIIGLLMICNRRSASNSTTNPTDNNNAIISIPGQQQPIRSAFLTEERPTNYQQPMVYNASQVNPSTVNTNAEATNEFANILPPGYPGDITSNVETNAMPENSVANQDSAVGEFSLTPAQSHVPTSNDSGTITQTEQTIDSNTNKP